MSDPIQPDPELSPEELREIAADRDIELPDDGGYVLDDDEDEPEGF